MTKRAANWPPSSFVLLRCLILQLLVVGEEALAVEAAQLLLRPVVGSA
jgi:hypothetical protein